MADVVTKGRTCQEDGCTKVVHARGWCDTHYARWQRHGDPAVGNIVYGGSCTRCEVELTPETSVPSKRKRNGLSSLCRKCHTAAARKWQAENPEKVRELGRRMYKRRKAEGTLRSYYTAEQGRRAALARYGVTEQWWTDTLSRQDGRCAICRCGPGSRNFSIDHDHNCCSTLPACGRCARGLLCTPCNFGIAAFDQPEWMASALAYLVKGPARG